MHLSLSTAELSPACITQAAFTNLRREVDSWRCRRDLRRAVFVGVCALDVHISKSYARRQSAARISAPALRPLQMVASSRLRSHHPLLRDCRLCLFRQCNTRSHHRACLDESSRDTRSIVGDLLARAVPNVFGAISALNFLLSKSMQCGKAQRGFPLPCRVVSCGPLPTYLLLFSRGLAPLWSGLGLLD